MSGWMGCWMGCWLDGWLDGWVAGWVDGWEDGHWVDGLMDGWMDGWVAEYVAGWVDAGGWMGGWVGSMDGWMDGWMWLEGKQQTLQPPSAKSDERFRDRTTVYAATVAHDRSGNERAVNVCKRSQMMKRGFYPGMNPIRFNYVWRVWAFMAILCINPSYEQ